jgi:hypothetical protein
MIALKSAVCLALLVMPAAAAEPEAGSAHLDYAAYAAGFNVVDVSTSIALDRSGYQVGLAFHTTGAFGLLFHSAIVSMVRGLWERGPANAQDVAPQRFASWGWDRGTEHRTLIDYRGGQPVIRDLVPPTDGERDPVPPAMQRDTMDTLSAMAMLLHRVATTGRCEGQAHIFDGRRLSVISATTGPVEVLAPERQSVFSGAALRCDFEGRQLAGFQHGVDEAELKRVKHGAAWIAHIVPGAPAMPVRIRFETRWFGHATMYVTHASPGAANLSAEGDGG